MQINQPAENAVGHDIIIVSERNYMDGKFKVLVIYKTMDAEKV